MHFKCMFHQCFQKETSECRRENAAIEERYCNVFIVWRVVLMVNNHFVADLYEKVFLLSLRRKGDR